MPRPARNQLSPWIENLILSFDSRPGGGCGGGGGRLKAHVVGVGRMTQSQALSCDGLSGLLFLSDGTLQIPAVLSSAAWERVQEQEERESFSSLLNTTVFIRHYQLRFHRSSLQTRSRFFLSVGEVSTTAAGPVRDNPPCSTSLASVRLKICQTWRSLQELQEPESQTSQSGLDLTELLDEWQHDCVQEVLDQLRSCTSASRLAHQDAATTGWDVDRIRHKGEEPFSVPVRCLLIPDDDDPQQPPTPPDAGDGARLSPASKDRETNLVHGHTTGPPVDDAEWTMAPTAADENSTLPVDSCVPHEDMMPLVIDSDLMPPSNPWDIFPPPSTTSSSSDASPEATPTDALHRRRSGPAAMVTSTQLPVSQLTSDDSKGGQSSVPPYQKLAHSTHLPTSTSTSTSTSITPASASASVSRPGPTDLSPAADRHVARTSRQDGVMWGTDTTETVEGKYRKVKKKRSDPTAEASPVAVEEQIIDPPSWLFDTQAGSEVKEVGGHKKGQGSGSALRKIPRVHSDGRPFSYCYGVTGQNLRDLSRFRVAESALHWAVRYLVPKQ